MCSSALLLSVYPLRTPRARSGSGGMVGGEKWLQWREGILCTFAFPGKHLCVEILSKLGK